MLEANELLMVGRDRLSANSSHQLLLCRVLGERDEEVATGAGDLIVVEQLSTSRGFRPVWASSYLLILEGDHRSAAPTTSPLLALFAFPDPAQSPQPCGGAVRWDFLALPISGCLPSRCLRERRPA